MASKGRKVAVFGVLVGVGLLLGAAAALIVVGSVRWYPGNQAMMVDLAIRWAIIFAVGALASAAISSVAVMRVLNNRPNQSRSRAALLGASLGPGISLLPGLLVCAFFFGPVGAAMSVGIAVVAAVFYFLILRVLLPSAS